MSAPKVANCPNQAVDSVHELATNMRRHCPHLAKPCKWVICGTCGATIELPTMRFFTGGAR